MVLQRTIFLGCSLFFEMLNRGVNYLNYALETIISFFIYNVMLDLEHSYCKVKVGQGNYHFLVKE